MYMQKKNHYCKIEAFFVSLGIENDNTPLEMILPKYAYLSKYYGSYNRSNITI